MRNSFPPVPRFFALNLAYTDNWTHVQHNTAKTTIYAHLVLTFFIDHHILCLQLLVKIYLLSPFNYFLQTKTNHYNCISYNYFRENKSIIRSLSPPLRLGFPTSCFPRFVVLNTKSPSHLFNPSPLRSLCSGYGFIFSARTRGNWLLLVLGWHLGGMHGRNS